MCSSVDGDFMLMILESLVDDEILRNDGIRFYFEWENDGETSVGVLGLFLFVKKRSLTLLECNFYIPLQNICPSLKT